MLNFYLHLLPAFYLLVTLDFTCYNLGFYLLHTYTFYLPVTLDFTCYNLGFYLHDMAVAV